MEKSALFLYSSLTGNGKIAKKLPKIKQRLGRVFETLDVVDCESEEDIEKAVKEAVGRYEALLFGGGDGTFNTVASVLAKVDNPPVLGYINAGTLGDVGRNFGIGKNLNRALSIIEEGQTIAFDLGQINDHYFAYMAAAGAYSDISYLAKRANKKRQGKFAYYALAIKEAFQVRRMEYRIDGGEKKTTPFLLVLNGRRVGGFTVNKHAKIDDGKIELFETKNGVFNGLLHYFFHSKGMKSTLCESGKIHIECPEDTVWCVDGEVGPKGSVDLALLPRHLRIYCHRKLASNKE